MGANPDLVVRSGDLKRDLVEFAHGPRYRRSLDRAFRDTLGEAVTLDEGRATNVLDHFILQRRQDDGRTVVEHFVEAHPGLPEAERRMLLGWRDVVEGVFAVQRQEGEALVVLNLVDELTYRVRSNMGSGVFAQMPPGSFIIARIVPVGDEWLLSGAMNVLPASDRATAARVASDLALRYPGLVFRNPQKLQQGWDLQRKDREFFIAFFGTDLVVLPGRDLRDRMKAYWRFRIHEARDEEGKSPAERFRESHGTALQVPDLRLPDRFYRAETVALIYDEVDGLNFYADFGKLEDAFANPALASLPQHRRVIRGYLEDDRMSPLPLRRLADRDPARASEVFRQVLKQPGFSWERDGEALLRKYKARYFEQPVLPSVVPASEKQEQAFQAASRGRVGRNDPCPCGSGKKYKKCHGERLGNPSHGQGPQPARQP